MKRNYKIMLLFLGTVALFYFLVVPNNYFLFCPMYKTSGLYCPGCGSQRAFHNMLHGNFGTALQYNAFFVLGIAAVLYHYGMLLANKVFDKDYKSLFLKPHLLWWIVGIAFVFMVVRNLPWYPFTQLVPPNLPNPIFYNGMRI